MDNQSNLFRSLKSVFLVNSAAFCKATVAEQTETLTKTEGKLVLFVDNFATLANKRTMLKRLVAGEDVSVELELNDVEISASELKTIADFRGILERIRGTASVYPWLPESDSEEALARVTFDKSSAVSPRVTINGYRVGLKTAEDIWKRASKFWSGGVKPMSFNKSVGGYNRDIYIYDTEVVAGCQKTSRATVEAIAKHYGWEPVLADA